MSDLIASDLVGDEADRPVIYKATGSELVSVQGRRFLDMEACNGAALLGYRNDLNVRTPHIELSSAPSFLETQIRLDLARRLVKLAPSLDDDSWRVAFETTGAAGIELALRIAAACVQGKPKIYTLAGGYHGRSVFLSSVSASERYRSASAFRVGEQIVRLPVVEESDPNVSAAIEFSRAYFKSDLWGGGAGNYADNTVAPIFVFESFQNVGGGVEPAKALIQAICQEVHAHGGIVIADETFTGIYRTGPRWGFQSLGLTPDIYVGAKALGNGVAPFSCVWARRNLLETGTVVPGMHSSTFASNANTLQIVSNVVDLLESTDIDAEVDRTGQRLRELGEKIDNSAAAVTSWRQVGATLRLRLADDYAPTLRRGLLNNGEVGVLVASTGLAPDTVLLFPPVTTSDSQFDIAQDALTRELASL